MRWSWLVFVLACGSPRANVDPGFEAGTDSSTTGDAPTDGMIIGEDAPPSLCPVNTWCVETSPVAATLLHSVWAVGANNVYAVGDNGVILRRRNNAWTQETSTTTSHLRGVWAASATDVWAVGDDGTVLRGDGVSWTAVGTFTNDFKAIWGSGADDVWFAAFGKIFHWDGQQFTSQNLTGELLAIHGTGPDDVWVTGENAKVDHFTGTWTTGIDPGGGTSYFGIHALGANNVFVAGFLPGAETRQFDGNNWTPRAAPGSVFQGFYSTGATNLWGVGGTKVGRWNGAGWAVETPVGAAAEFWSVSGVGSNVWVVGSESLILYRN